MGEVSRCARDRWCAAPEKTLDEEGRKVTLPAEVLDTALCDVCVRELRWALAALPIDMADLTVLMVPSMEVRYRDPDMPDQPRSKKHPPLPLNGHAEALRALIDHEVTSWATSTADIAELDTDSTGVDRSRPGARVQHGARFLLDHLDHMLGLPVQQHRARSTGEDPTDGHDPDVITRYGHDVWIERDGTDAALVLLDLHRRVEQMVGRSPADRLPVPCPMCNRQALHRIHARMVVSGSVRPGTPAKVVCRRCWTEMSDDEYERLTTMTCAVFGVRL